MAIKIKIKKQSQGCAESVERVDEIFGLPNIGSKEAETTRSIARKGLSDKEHKRLIQSIETHQPGSSELNGKKNPYGIPEGEPPIELDLLLNMFISVMYGSGTDGKPGRAGLQFYDRVLGIIGSFVDKASKSDSDVERFEFINRARIYMDDLYRRLLAKGIDPETGEKKPGKDDDGKEAPLVSCPDGYKWVAREDGKSVAGGQKGDCVNDKGEVAQPCPDGQTWDSEAGKCVDGGDEETPPPGGEDKPAVPIYKFPKERGEDGKRLQPLSSKLAKAGLNKATINTILRSIAKQLKSNNVEITEGLLKEATSMVLERLSLTEKRKENLERNKKSLQQVVDQMKLKPGTSTKISRKVYTKKFGEWPNGLGKKSFMFAINSGGEVRLYSIDKAGEQQAERWAGKPPVDTTETPEEKGPPKSWVTEGGTQEEWDALPNKEKFVFLKMDKKRKFFKMSSEERLELYDEMKKGGATKASTGAEKTADAQAAAGEKAAEKGFGDEAYKQGDGKIRISTLNQQLKTIDPQADQGERKKALNLVQKHLKPYLKINNLKLSESEIRDFTNQIVEVILKSSR